MPLKHLLILLFIAVAHGSAFPFTKLVLNDSVPPILMSSLRMGLVLVILIPFWKFKIPEKKYLPSLIAFSISMGVMVYVFMTLSLYYSSIISPVIVGSQLAIPFGILASAFMLNENISTKKWFFIFFAFIGVLIIFFDPKLVDNFLGLFLTVVIILLILTQKALYSPWGRMMRAIRDNEEAANAMGKNVVKQHLLIFVLGSAIVGIAGAMLVTQDGLFTPGSYRPMRYTFLIWVMVIVGGSGNNFGAILGGFVVWFLWIEAAPISLYLINFFTVGISEANPIKSHLIESVPYFRFLVMGLGLLLIMRYRPKGILPEKIEIK